MATNNSGPVKAYKNLDFLNSRAARSIRIQAEYLEPEVRFEKYGIKDTIVFFGSARFKSKKEAEALLAAARKSGEGLETAERDVRMSRFYEDARELSKRLTIWSKELGDEHNRRFVVCTGGGPGIMEAANRGASEAKGINIGLNISLPFEQHDNPYITRELCFEFHYFFMRKFWFLYPAKTVIVFPGGFGTMDELFEVLTLDQTGKLTKQINIVLYGKDYWDRVGDFDTFLEYGTISPEDVELFTITDSVDEAFEIVTTDLMENALKSPGPVL
ncbi:MAG: LOG family protein [Rhodospirillaceae bacterium]|jgi:uncharacterized protein (TIGR00730 family)